jgi:hypothetical protein
LLVGGGAARRAQVYAPGFVKSILQGLKKAIKKWGLMIGAADKTNWMQVEIPACHVGASLGEEVAEVVAAWLAEEAEADEAVLQHWLMKEHFPSLREELPAEQRLLPDGASLTTPTVSEGDDDMLRRLDEGDANQEPTPQEMRSLEDPSQPQPSCAQRPGEGIATCWVQTPFGEVFARREVRCPTCEARPKPSPARPSMLPRRMQFN